MLVRCFLINNNAANNKKQKIASNNWVGNTLVTLAILGAKWKLWTKSWYTGEPTGKQIPRKDSVILP